MLSNYEKMESTSQQERRSEPEGKDRRPLLVPRGSLLVCDHVNSRLSSHYRAAHFMTVEEHLSTFKELGFVRAREICAAADLSLMGAEKP
jgi:hypothetical protein